MSLDTLPLELLHQIARVPYVLRQPDFLSLSRVSKRLLPFARSHLYRSVRLFISAAWFDEKRDDFDRVGPEKFTRDLFFRTITDAPHLASKITTLSLIIDPKSLEASWNVCQGNYDITDKTIEFLRACINLTNLTLERPGGTGDGDTPFEIIYAIPTTVRTFRIRNRPVGPLGLARLLSHLSSLFELDLSQSTTIELEQTRLPVPGTLTVIRLPGEDTKLFPFLREIVDAIPSLRSFDGPPASLEMLIRRPLEPLKQLTIRGFVDPSRDQVSYDQLLLKIVATALDSTWSWLWKRLWRFRPGHRVDQSTAAYNRETRPMRTRTLLDGDASHLPGIRQSELDEELHILSYPRSIYRSLNSRRRDRNELSQSRNQMQMGLYLIVILDSRTL